MFKSSKFICPQSPVLKPVPFERKQSDFLHILSSKLIKNSEYCEENDEMFQKQGKKNVLKKKDNLSTRKKSILNFLAEKSLIKSSIQRQGC